MRKIIKATLCKDGIFLTDSLKIIYFSKLKKKVQLGNSMWLWKEYDTQNNSLELRLTSFEKSN